MICIKPLRFLALLLVVLLSACRYEAKPEQPISAKHVIIFVPGYKGSRLVESDSGATVWISVSEILFRNRSLTLPRPGLELGPTLSLHAKGVLTAVDIVPWLIDYSVYGEWLNQLSKHYGSRATIIPFDYDWRENHTVHLPRLARLIEQLRSQGTARITLIGHSMGGLIVSAYLRFGATASAETADSWNGATMVDEAVVLGAPFRGSIIMFHDMLRGTRTGWNSSLLNQTALASFGSCYDLLPSSDSQVLVTDDSVDATTAIRDAATWRRYGWGMFRDTQSLGPEVLAAREQFMESALSGGDTFLRRLNAPTTYSAKNTARYLHITSNHHQTLERGLLSRNPGEVTFEQAPGDKRVNGRSSPNLYGLGDGLLSTVSTNLPEAFRRALPTKEISLPLLHAEMMDDSDAQRAIFTFIDSGPTAGR